MSSWDVPCDAHFSQKLNVSEMNTHVNHYANTKYQYLEFWREYRVLSWVQG